MKKVLVLYALSFIITMLESGNAMKLGNDFVQSLQDKNVWIYQGNLDSSGLKKVEEVLLKNEDAFNEIDGYITLPNDKHLTFPERANLISWAQDKQQEMGVNKILYRFIWMSLVMLKDAMSSMSSGLMSDWINGHQNFFFRR